MKHTFSFLKILTIFLTIFVLHPCFSYSLKVDTIRIYKEVKPGDVIEGVINVINDKETPTEISMEIEDLDYESEKQNMLFKPYGTQKDTCSRWINLTPKKTSIPSGGSRAINYVITIPKEGIDLAEYYSVVFVTTSSDAPDTSKSIVLASKARIGIVVKLTMLDSSKPSGVIESFNVTPAKDDTPFSMTYSFHNTGNILQKVTGSFSIIDLDGNLFGRGTVNTGVSKPGDKILINTPWDGELDPGTYDLIAELKYRPDNVEIKEVRFESEYKTN